MTDGPHLTSEEVAGYLDNTLSEAECARVKAHLADCDVCRGEIVSVSRLVEGAPRSRRRFITLSAMATAAAVAVIFLARPSNDSDLPPVGSLRGPGSPAAAEGVLTVRAIAPMGQQTTSDGIVFVWHPAAAGAAYRLTLTDDRGAKRWVGTTNDTTLAIPKGTRLVPDRTYHWYVDVMQPDGGAATTGITTFQVSR